LWPSETDPNRAHWLRNEVIAFERVLVTLREERDVAVQVLQREEEIGAQLAAAESIAQADMEARDQKYTEAIAKNLEMREEIGCLEDNLFQAEQAKAVLDDDALHLGTAQSQLETQHRSARNSVNKQLNVQKDLETKCAEMCAEIERLRNNPKVPPEYAEHVFRMDEAHKARIATLQEEMHRLQTDVQDLECDNVATERQLLEFEHQCGGAEKAVADATTKLKSHDEKKHREYAELEELQQIYYNLPEKIEEETITREVTREVNREIMFN